MTYRELRNILNRFTEDQLDMDITVEDKYEDECFFGELRICGPNHQSLEEDHPVIFF